MTSGLGSISLTGQALGMSGIGGSIDTDALIDALMDAKSIPQKRLKLQLEQQQGLEATLQGLKAQFTAMRNTAWKVDDSDSWAVTSATASHSGVTASTDIGALTGSATFRVTSVATAQVSTVSADATGNVVDDPNSGIQITIEDGGDGSPVTHDIALTGGSTADVAAAINKAGIGVRAAVVTIDDANNPGQTTTMLQLTSDKTGTAAAFTATGFNSPGGGADEIVAATNAQIAVGSFDANGNQTSGYTVSSQNNTFTDTMPGVSFTVSSSAVGQDVTITVGRDTAKVSGMVSAMIDAANAAKGAISSATGKDGALQGRSEIRLLGFDMANLVSSGVPGTSFTAFGIDMDKDGNISFDAARFAAAYAADAQGTEDAITALAHGFADVGNDALAPVYGAVTSSIDSITEKVQSINRDITMWNERLDQQRVQLTIKYTEMQSALARLQGQSDWLTSMFDSLNNKDK